jgi:hypothetical protein
MALMPIKTAIVPFVQLALETIGTPFAEMEMGPARTGATVCCGTHYGANSPHALAITPHSLLADYRWINSRRRSGERNEQTNNNTWYRWIIDRAQSGAMIAQAVRSAEQGGYALESMAADLIVRIVERYLADYRSVFADRARLNDLMDSLDVFVRAGWPSAQSLTFRLGEIWR